MALTLAQSALLSENDLQAGVLETFVQESVILDRIPFMDIEGNAFAYNEELALPGVEFRAVNAAYTESTGTVNQKTDWYKVSVTQSLTRSLTPDFAERLDALDPAIFSLSPAPWVDPGPADTSRSPLACRKVNGWPGKKSLPP